MDVKCRGELANEGSIVQETFFMLPHLRIPLMDQGNKGLHVFMDRAQVANHSRERLLVQVVRHVRGTSRLIMYGFECWDWIR
eukprot:6479166-Amphidinium_carterae.1